VDFVLNSHKYTEEVMEALVARIGKLTKGLIVKKPKKKKRVYMDMDDSGNP
jgi:hypothetical protein